MPDTTICAGDTLRLYANSDGLRFLWEPAATVSNPAQPQTVGASGCYYNLYHSGFYRQMFGKG
jgi:hypothetical protein